MRIRTIHALYMAAILLFLVASLVFVVAGNQRLKNQRAEIVLPDVEVGQNYYYCDRVHGGLIAKHYHIVPRY